MSELIPAVAYWRMSSSPQEKSIPQQRAEMLPKCKLERVELAAEFKDEAVSGGKMTTRDAFLEMLAFCQARHKSGKPVSAIACYDTSRFSRANSIKTARYIDEFMDVGVCRVFTWERWFDFRKEEDRAIFLLQQDFTNNRYLRDHSRRVLRGKKASAQAGYFPGGPVPYAFDRMIVDAAGRPIQRIPRGEKIKLRANDWHVVASPVPADDPDPARQLQRQTVVWLYESFANLHVSYRWLALQLNERQVPAPGRRRRPKRSDPPRTGPAKWTPDTVQDILTSPLYAGLFVWGRTAQGEYHRFVNGEVEQVEPGQRPKRNTQGLVETKLAEAIIPRQLWEQVQRKVATRQPKGHTCRTGGFLLAGLVRCGHCGSTMHGETSRPLARNGQKRYAYRVYACPSARRRPGTCRAYRVHESKLVPALIRKLQKVYLAPERLRGLEAALLQKLKARHQGSPQQAQRLQLRLGDLEAEIVQGRRNLFRAKDDDTFAALNEELKACLARRDRLTKELEAAQKQQETPAADVARKVKAALAKLRDLRDELGRADKARLGAVLRQMVVGIDLYFEPVQHGHRPWYVFRRGLVKLRPGLEMFSGSAQNEASFSVRCPARAGARPRSRTGARAVHSRYAAIALARRPASAAGLRERRG
jgi:site-specific DNA recombinase